MGLKYLLFVDYKGGNNAAPKEWTNGQLSCTFFPYFEFLAHLFDLQPHNTWIYH